MAIRVLWLLTYVGFGLALALGNRPSGGNVHLGNVGASVSGGLGQRPDYRYGISIRKSGELNPLGGNLLHLGRAGTHPYAMTGHRDTLADWVVYDREPVPGATGHPSPGASMLIDEIIGEPRELENVFLALSPAVLNVLYPEYVSGLGQAQPFVYGAGPSLIGQRHRGQAKQQQQQQQQHHQTDTGDRHRAAGKFHEPPLLMLEPSLEAGESPRQSSLDEDRATTLKTETAARQQQQQQQPDGVNGLVPSANRLTAYQPAVKPKRGQISLGRRSAEIEQHQQQMPPTSASFEGASIASQFMLRSARGNRQYDVPQIECPASDDGMERFACPTADRMGRYRCIDDHVLCDGFIDCPTGEDEDRQACMFYKTTKAHLDVLADALLRWARGR